MGIETRTRGLRKFVLTNSQGAGSISLAAPGSGATITIWDSGQDLTGSAAGHPFWRAFRRYIFSLLVSHPGTLLVEVSSDDGTNWETHTSVAVPGGATIFQRDIYPGGYARGRFRYTNSASSLTTWRGQLEGEPALRALAA